MREIRKEFNSNFKYSPESRVDLYTKTDQADFSKSTGVRVIIKQTSPIYQNIIWGVMSIKLKTSTFDGFTMTTMSEV